MKMLLLIALLIMPAIAHAETAFYTGERIDGMTKICFYRSARGTTAINISSVAICPLTIQV